MRAAKNRKPRLRYTKAALLLFGLGLVLGFVIVVGEFRPLERVASALMAAALVLLPVALVADGPGPALVARFARRRRGGRGARARAGARPAARPRRSRRR